MRFSSKFGLGEIVLTHQGIREDARKILQDQILRVIGVCFGLDGTTNYLCRLDDGHLVQFLEQELIGDENFDQELGCYTEPCVGEKALTATEAVKQWEEGIAGAAKQYERDHPPMCECPACEEGLREHPLDTYVNLKLHEAGTLPEEVEMVPASVGVPEPGTCVTHCFHCEQGRDHLILATMKPSPDTRWYSVQCQTCHEVGEFTADNEN